MMVCSPRKRSKRDENMGVIETEEETMKENMKALMQKVSYSLAIAICELALGVLLLLSPSGFTSALFVVLAILLIVLGIISIINYIRLPREDSAKT